MANVYAMEAYRGVEVRPLAFITSALYLMSCQVHAPASLPQLERGPDKSRIGWKDPGAGLDALEERNSFPC